MLYTRCSLPRITCQQKNDGTVVFSNPLLVEENFGLGLCFNEKIQDVVDPIGPCFDTATYASGHLALSLAML